MWHDPGSFSNDNPMEAPKERSSSVYNTKHSPLNPTHATLNYFPPTNMSDFNNNFLQANLPGEAGFTTGYNSYQLDWSDFEISDFLIPENDSEEGSTSAHIECGTSNPVFREESVAYDGVHNSPSSSNIERKPKAEEKKSKTDAGSRVAFRTKSELEIMDDGYKWRKYGKKSVKNCPNPRNYFRCSHQGCQVKKRVQRDREDASYVITTYDGVHNHESPSILYYNEMPLMVPNGWTLQASQSSC